MRNILALMAPIAIVVVLIAYLAFTNTQQQTQAPETALPQQTMEAPQTFIPKASEGEISIELTPAKYENGIFVVQYSLNTHSIDMRTIDLQQQAALMLNGTQYKPINRPVLSGHHNSGELKFSLPAKPESFEIIIADVPDVKERRFSWP